MRKAEANALQSQLESLRGKIRDYEGLSQKDLAGRLGLKEQQVQRHESTDYASASLERVRAVIRALGVAV